MIGPRRVGVDVQACGSYFRLDRVGYAAQWLQQVRSVLGRLGAIAAVLQIGPLLSAPLCPRRSSPLALPKAVLYVWSMIWKSGNRFSEKIVLKRHEIVIQCDRITIWENAGSVPMRVLGAVVGAGVAMALLAGPAHAQMSTPNVNLIPELQSKTPEEKEQDAIKEKAYRESLKKIPDAKASNDPWGNVRSTDTPKTAAPAKPKTKTGSTTN